VNSVAIVIESFGGGGAQHVASALANHWVENGIAVTAITFSGAQSDVFKLDNRVRRIVVGGIKSLAPDVVKSGFSAHYRDAADVMGVACVAP